MKGIQHIAVANTICTRCIRDIEDRLCEHGYDVDCNMTHALWTVLRGELITFLEDRFQTETEGHMAKQKQTEQDQTSPLDGINVIITNKATAQAEIVVDAVMLAIQTAVDAQGEVLASCGSGPSDLAESLEGVKRHLREKLVARTVALTTSKLLDNLGSLLG